MIKKFLIFLILTTIAGTGSAQTALSPAEAAALLPDVFTDDYAQWERAEIAGKLDMDMLPIRPSVKIYMERDRVIRLSMRAPLLGEVGRLEINNDSLLVVDKFNRQYASVKMSEVQRHVPVTVGNMQDLLLHRIFSLGKSTLDPAAPDAFTVYSNEKAESLSFIPVELTQATPYYYAFESALTGELLTFVCGAASNTVQAVIDYSYKMKSYEMYFTLVAGSRQLNARLTLDDPRFGQVNVMEPATVQPRYRKMDLSKLLAALKSAM